MIFFLILYGIITVLLALSLLGSVLAYHIKAGLNFILLSIIGLFAIILCSILAIHFPFYYCLYGIFMFLFEAYLMFSTKSPFIGSLISCLLGLFFWPQFVCLMIFTALNFQNIDIK